MLDICENIESNLLEFLHILSLYNPEVAHISYPNLPWTLPMIFPVFRN